MTPPILPEPRPAPAPARSPRVEAAFSHLAALAEAVDATGYPTPLDGWVAALRHFMTAYGTLGDMPNLEGIHFEAVSAGGVPAQWVTADGADPDVRLVYLHGGGWASGTLTDYRWVAGALAQMTRASILLVDYRLSPEHPFPAGLEDCVAAFDWAAGAAPGGRLAKARHLVLAGDSAGGNLAAVTCLLALERGLRAPDRLALIAGTFDQAPADARIGRDDPVCTPEGFANCNQAYLGATRPETPLVSPVYADAALLSRFPPTLLQVSGTEALLHDSQRFAARLIGSDVRTILDVWPGLPHVWHFFLGHLPEAEAALRELARFLIQEERA